MDRTLVYATEQPTDTLWLTLERNHMIAEAYLAQGVLGVNTVVDGLACIPTVPASLAVQIGPGAVYSVEPVDSSSYGSLPVDVVDQIVKQGIALSVPNLTLVPPSTSGQAVNYLVQVQLSEIDTGNAVLPYFDSANPTIPFTGPNGSGTAQPTTRQCTLVVQAKAGIAATAGSQVTPSPDAGWTGLYSITVANGATAIASGQITTLPTAPFIAVKLPQVPAWVQGGTYLYATDTGTANAIGIALTPQPTTPPASLLVRKINTANNAAMTITIVGVGTFALLNSDASAITSGEMTGNYLAHLGYDGTSYRFINGTTTTAVGSLSAQSGEGINVDGTGHVALNFPSLTDDPAIAGGDLFGRFSQAQNKHEVSTFTELLASVKTTLPGSLLRITPFSANGTFTKGANTRMVWVFATGAGGGGGGAQGGDSQVGAGGGAGGTAIALVDVTGVPTVAVGVGTGGLGGFKSGNASIDGAAGIGTSFGSYATATGGQGGQGNTSAVQNFGGRPGTGTAGDVLLTGNPGENGNRDCGGNGGGSFWGGSGQGIAYFNNAGTGNGFAGSKGGGGGAGDNQGSSSVTGGNGGNGFVLVLEFS